ncbi:hypothetical protein M3Y99_00197800 [Aphelenchoides fujianensis]|nr:hypothetical protein M3Y99_00197800 [Aphelenchoides fujianensis]
MDERVARLLRPVLAAVCFAAADKSAKDRRLVRYTESLFSKERSDSSVLEEESESFDAAPLNPNAHGSHSVEEICRSDQPAAPTAKPRSKTLPNHCTQGKKGHELQLEAAERTENVWPEKHEFVPHLLFNNVSLLDAQVAIRDLPAAICDWIVGEKPDGCKGFGHPRD